jgi:hypothetical protein
MKFLSLHSAERIGSVIVVAALACLVRDPRMWFTLVISVALGHYILSLIYSRKQVAQVCSQPSSMVPFAGLLLCSVLLYLGEFPLIILFGIHHVFNEVYLLNRTLKLHDGPDAAALRTASIVVNFLLYIATVRRYPELQFINHAFLFAGVAVACIVFLVVLLKAGKLLSASQLLDCCIFEVVGLALLAVSFYHRINVYHVVLYHCTFWGVYPLQKMARQGGGEVARYAGLNIAALFAGFLISPLSFLHAFRLSDMHWDAVFRLSSIIHIMMAFGLSTAHPAWITKWFQGRVRNTVSRTV